MNLPNDLDGAALAAQAARERLAATAGELQDRLAPANLLDEAVTGARDGGAALVRTTSDAARRQPAVAAGVAGTILLFLLRGPLRRAGRRLTGRAPKTR